MPGLGFSFQREVQGPPSVISDASRAGRLGGPGLGCESVGPLGERLRVRTAGRKKISQGFMRHWSFLGFHESSGSPN